MNLLVRGCLLLVCLASCGSEAGPPGGGDRPAGLLYQATPWTKPAGAQFGAATCRVRRSVPGCETFPEPSVRATAVDDRRLVVLMEGDRLGGVATWELLVSDDLGGPVRRFALAGIDGNGRDASLHLFQGRIFLLSSVNGPEGSTAGSARVFEVDPLQGTVTAVAGSATMSSAFGVAKAGGVLTTVAFARDRPPQVIAVTRFDPATGSIRRDELACDVAGCAPAGYTDFLSSDGETFDVLLKPASAPGESCLLTVHAGSQTVASECFPGLDSDAGAALSSRGGHPYDFRLSTREGVAPTLVPVSRHWLPNGAGISFGAQQVAPIGEAFVAFSPSAFTREGDGVLLRPQATGQPARTVLSHEGCFGFRPGGACPQLVDLQALPGDEVLLITERDESHDDDHARPIFEVGRATATFTAFAPGAP
jgi:hypothetical protein